MSLEKRIDKIEEDNGSALKASSRTTLGAAALVSLCVFGFVLRNEARHTSTQSKMDKGFIHLEHKLDKASGDRWSATMEIEGQNQVERKNGESGWKGLSPTEIRNIQDNFPIKSDADHYVR